MNDLIIHHSIEDAEPADFSPIYGDDDDSTEIPCFDFFFESGVLELVHVPMPDSFVIMPDFVRFDARGPLDPNALRERLAVGGVLRNAIVEVRCAALIDRALLAACRAFSAELESLIEDGGDVARRTADKT